MPNKLVERFLKYVKIYTTSEEGIEKVPSTERQFDLANILVTELKELGIDNANVDEFCIVKAEIESNLPDDIKKKVPGICLLAHMDTSPEEPGENVNPQLIKEYNGDEITLPKDTSVKINLENTPSLRKFIGTDIITADGTTLLGADNKAGIAEIMTALSIMLKEGKPHGRIVIVFTPDEEVGTGVLKLDVSSLGCKFGFTIDGDEMGVLETETFNAAGGTITIKGFNTHPGYAKDKMINAIRLLPNIITLFPNDESPETTEGYEGYYHPYEISGSVNEVKIKYILRDFDYNNLENKMKVIEDGIESLRNQYSKIDIILDQKTSYKNMKVVIDKYPQLVEYAKEAIERAGIKVITKPVRGGTDGARLSFKGLPTPNIFSGGMNYHSKEEVIPINAMEKTVETILNLIDIFVERAS